MSLAEAEKTEGLKMVAVEIKKEIYAVQNF